MRYQLNKKHRENRKEIISQKPQIQIQRKSLSKPCQLTSRHRKITRKTTIKRILEDQTKITETNQTKTPMVINNKRTFFKIVALSAMAVLTACNSIDFFNEYQSLPDGWKKSEPLVFDFESLDTISTHNAYL